MHFFPDTFAPTASESVLTQWTKKIISVFVLYLLAMFKIYQFFFDKFL